MKVNVLEYECVMYIYRLPQNLEEQPFEILLGNGEKEKMMVTSIFFSHYVF